MVRRRWLLGVIVVVPLIGIASSAGLRLYFDSQLRNEVKKQYPAADPARIAGVTVTRLCEEAAGRPAFCSTYDNVTLLGTGATVALMTGLGLLLAIRIAGSAAKGSRIVLLRTFGPGLYLAAITTILLIASHGVIAMTALWYVETTLTQRIHGGLLIAIGLGAGAGILAVARNMLAAVRPAETFVFGKRIDRNQGRQLYERVEKLAASIGALQPQHIVVGLDPSFFVTEAKVKCLNGEMTGRTLFCSLALCRIMTRQEFDAVLGHELGHYKGLDTEFSKKFYPIYRGTLQSLASLQSAGEGARVVALLPALGVLGYFYEAFSIAESEHSRQRELAADREGVSVSTKNAMASALVKVHAFAGYWEHAQQAAVEAIDRERPLANLSKAYADFVEANANDAAIKGIGSRHAAHPTDSHPTLDIRLKSIGVTVGTVAMSSLNVKPQEPASGLLPNLEELEEGLSESLQALIAEHLQPQPIQK